MEFNWQAGNQSHKCRTGWTIHNAIIQRNFKEFSTSGQFAVNAAKKGRNRRILLKKSKKIPWSYFLPFLHETLEIKGLLKQEQDMNKRHARHVQDYNKDYFLVFCPIGTFEFRAWMSAALLSDVQNGAPFLASATRAPFSFTKKSARWAPLHSQKLVSASAKRALF